MTDALTSSPSPDAPRSASSSRPPASDRSDDAAAGPHGPSRRQFLQYAGGTLGIAALVLSGCDSNDGGMTMTDPPPMDGDGTVTLDFSTDFGVLNYAYALEQLEAAFYTAAAANFYGDAGSIEAAYFNDLAAHEQIHRDFLAAAIPALGGELIPNLEVDFSSIDFDNRDEVLGISQVLEDTGVSAYNGAGIFLQDPDLLTIAGKIVSVEARHAAAVRSFINPGSADFAGDDVVDVMTGLDVATSPADVLAAVANTGLVTTPIEVVNAS